MMNLSKIRKALISTIAAAVALCTFGAAAAHAFSSDDQGQRTVNGRVMVALVDYVGERRADVRMYVTDTPGDIWCTAGYAKLLDAYGRQLGQNVRLGSVCGGRALWLPDSPINTAAGDIRWVMVWTDNNAGFTCDRLSDVSYHVCK